VWGGGYEQACIRARSVEDFLFMVAHRVNTWCLGVAHTTLNLAALIGPVVAGGVVDNKVMLGVWSIDS
jgi:hypothetical protein